MNCCTLAVLNEKIRQGQAGGILLPNLRNALNVVSKLIASPRLLKMRNIFFLIVLAFNFTISIGQTVLDTDGLNNLNNVYLYSLKVYCQSLDSTKSKVVYVRDDHFIGDNWPKQILDFEIRYLETDNQYITAINENNGSAIIVGITPFDFRKGEFSCGIIPFSATYKDNNISMVNGGGLNIYFAYDSKRNGLIYKRKKWTGI